MARPVVTRTGGWTWALATRQIVVAGVLGAISIFLGTTRLGFIPVPNLSGDATIMHIPAILGGVLEGPIVGVLAGFIFGMFSWLNATVPLFRDPSVSVLPRLFIGLAGWAVFALIRPRSLALASVVSGVAGSLTNTILVIGMIVLRGLVPRGVSTGAFVLSVVPQAIAEATLAAIVTLVVVRGVSVYRSGIASAPDTQSGGRY